MGWKSDWLYDLVFQEVARVWEQSRKESASLGPPPSSFRVLEYPKGDWDGPHCRGQVQRAWLYDEAGLQPAEIDEDHKLVVQNAMYDVGVVHFHIAPSRKQVVFEFVLGPLYGRGRILDVVGQGSRGTLKRSMNREWVS